MEPRTKDSILRKKLLCGKYDKTERPVKNHKDVVTVNVHLDLHGFNYDGDQQKLSINVWLALQWKDTYLSWSPVEYEGIDMFAIASDDIWQPNLMPYSSLSNSNLEESCAKPMCTVDPDGTVKYISPCDFHMLCDSDYTNWPFDRLNCTLRIGMWVEDSSQVDFDQNTTSVRANDGDSHNQWRIIGSTVKKHEALISSDIEIGNTTYPSLIYNFILQRHSGTQTIIIVAPALVMIAINLVSLWLNCDSRERLFLLGGNTFMHFTFIEHIYWQIPYNGSAVPLIVIFFRDSLILTVLILVATVLIKHLSMKEAVDPPEAIGSVIKVLTGNSIGSWIFGIHSDQSGRPEEQRGHETSASSEDNSDDTSVLVGEDQLSESVSKVVLTKSKAYKTVALVLDKCLFLGIVLLYVLMLIAVIPRL